MKDLRTDDALAEKLTELSNEVMHLVIEGVDHADEAEFVLSASRDFFLENLQDKGGERWFREQKRIINGEKNSRARAEESAEEQMKRMQYVFHRVLKVMEQLSCADDAFFVLSCCRNAMRDVFKLTPAAMESAENAAALIGEKVSDRTKANILADKPNRGELEGA